ncbi:hypothetical protein [Actinokineospora sp. NBRC 105648]|uniref:hypothetical protein n=1 Tax=Actinokineospora sp. NBRC 105648 TaxID=3032206 RepID=UPI0024A48C84|nr:hypothetical protein [Actinokineospora sp. NBRC 105648]GLZ41315.1 hypothetical protein Acsp05_49390 [Actinokineospora sp. NBRC 105648]
MVRPLHPAHRDAAAAKVVKVTVGVVALSVAGTLGIGAAIAATAPMPKSEKADYTGKSAKEKPTLAPAEDRPESSSGDEQTTSGGS